METNPEQAQMRTQMCAEQAPQSRAVEERCGTVSFTRHVKDDGRALLLYRHIPNTPDVHTSEKRQAHSSHEHEEFHSASPHEEESHSDSPHEEQP